MSFELNKKNCLNKLDKSKIGAIDKDIRPLVDLINKSDNYYTTSSCAGRIVILAHNNHKKNECEWLLSSHDTITLEQAKKALKDIPKDKDIWLMEESTIIHIDCRTLEHAIQLLNLAKPLGFKRSGITSIGNKIILEIMATEHMDTIIGKQGQIIIDDNYLNITIQEANKKLLRTKKKIKRIEQQLKKYIKK